MATSSPEGELLICDFNGTARSGKGTIVKYLAEHYNQQNPGSSVEVEEIGRDYRTMTLDLIESETISGDDKLAVQNAVAERGEGYFSALIARRDSFYEKYGEEALHGSQVDNLVGMVAAIPILRAVVKDALRDRIAARVTNLDPAQANIVLMDGRNLSKAIQGVKGARILMRTFVECSDLEAALRECSDETEFLEAGGAEKLEAIKKRNQADRQRQIDPVIHDQKVIDYWLPSALYHRPEIRKLLVARNRAEYLDAAHEARQQRLAEAPMSGIGRHGVMQERQILFNTTPFRAYPSPKDAMLEAAYQMFIEAVKAA